MSGGSRDRPGNKDMSIVVALETATTCCSVAVATPDGTLLAEVVAPAGPAHTRRLLPDLHHALQIAGAGVADIETVVIGLGPGTFTGLRIGVATARALAQAGGARLVGVPTLEALAWALAEGDAAAKVRTYVALIDGKRREVFAACYARAAGAAVHDARGADGAPPPADVAEAPRVITPSLTVLRTPTVVPADELLDFLVAWPSAVVGGDGAHLYRDRLPASTHLARAIAAPTAVMALRAWRAGVPGVVEGLPATVPIYGRAPDAARWTERQRAAAPGGGQRRGGGPSRVRGGGA
jgi:tRNA threonylcarbamoyl adenosine modification protein YeaZ